MPNDSFEKVPEGVNKNIVSFLNNRKDLLSLSSVSTKWHKLTKAPIAELARKKTQELEEYLIEFCFLEEEDEEIEQENLCLDDLIDIGKVNNF